MTPRSLRIIPPQFSGKADDSRNGWRLSSVMRNADVFPKGCERHTDRSHYKTQRDDNMPEGYAEKLMSYLRTHGIP